MPMQIKNSVFLVTGGASGLGAATARMAAENGGKVVIADMQADVGEKFAKEIGARFVKTDVTSEADGKAAVERVLKEFGGLQVLVNCAGIAAAERSLGKQVPFPSRLGRPGEYAQLVKAIIEIEMLNAETIRLDGAIRMAPR